MPAKDKQLVANVASFLANILSSVCIVFVNKRLMSPSASGGSGFSFAATLCAFHFLSCSMATVLAQSLGLIKGAKVPWKDIAIFTAVANTSIASLNISLLINSVGFYQIAKLAIVPFVAAVEVAIFQRVISRAALAAMATVLLGVSIVTISSVQLTTTGLLVAVLSVVSSGSQQILCGHYQRKHAIASHQLLANTAPWQGWSLLLLGPLIDRAVTGGWVSDFTVTVPAVYMLTASCVVAVAVNLSQFACLGRFSAVTFQVLGHSKTVLVLLGGWALLGDIITGRQVVGMVLAVAGMAAYGVASDRAAQFKASKEEGKPKISSLQALLNRPPETSVTPKAAT